MRINRAARERSVSDVRPSAFPPRHRAYAPNIHTSCAVVVAPTFERAFATWCLTVECETQAVRGRLLRPGDEHNYHDLAGRSFEPSCLLAPSASRRRATHPDPRSAGCRLLSRFQHLSGAPSSLRTSWTPVSRHRRVSQTDLYPGVPSRLPSWASCCRCHSYTPGSQSLPNVAEGPMRGSSGAWPSRKACTYARSWLIRART